MGLVLVEFSRDWADEFQAEGFDIMTVEQWEKLKTKLESGPSFYFGTNEGWEEEDLSDSVTAKPISPEDADVIYRFFPDLKREERSYEYDGATHTYMAGSAFGQFPSIDYDDDEEEEEE